MYFVASNGVYSSNMAAASCARKWGTLLTSPRELKTRFNTVTVAVPVRIQFSFCDRRLLVLLCCLRFRSAVGILLADEFLRTFADINSTEYPTTTCIHLRLLTEAGK